VDRASLIIAIAFAGGTVLLIAALWLLIRLDRLDAEAMAHTTRTEVRWHPVARTHTVVVGLLKVLFPDPDEVPRKLAASRPLATADALPHDPSHDASRSRAGLAGEVTAFIAILLLIVNTRRHRRIPYAANGSYPAPGPVS
jgi:hypothetical protein